MPHLSGGASRLASLLLPRIYAISSVVAPCDPGAAPESYDTLYGYGTLVTTVYVHGYDARERQRLLDQAASLVELLHHDTRYPTGSRVLEAGCGVGRKR